MLIEVVARIDFIRSAIEPFSTHRKKLACGIEYFFCQLLNQDIIFAHIRKIQTMAKEARNLVAMNAMRFKKVFKPASN